MCQKEKVKGTGGGNWGKISGYRLQVAGDWVLGTGGWGLGQDAGCRVQGAGCRLQGRGTGN